jgi:hypothetical protein
VWWRDRGGGPTWKRRGVVGPRGGGQPTRVGSITMLTGPDRSGSTIMLTGPDMWPPMLTGSREGPC